MMIGALFDSLLPWALTIGGAIAALFVARQSGKRSEKAKQIEARFKAMHRKKEVEKEVVDADRDDVVDANTRD